MLGRSQLSPQQEELLALMRRDNMASVVPFRASDFWKDLNKLFDDLFCLVGIKDVESQKMNQWFSGHAPHRLLSYAAYMLYRHIKIRDELTLLSKIPSTVGRDSGQAFVFDGNYVSWDTLISIDTPYSISEVDDSIWSKPVVVLDFGAGWGRIGYILKSVNPNSVYIACDLPGGLLVSSAYLPRLLPQERTYSYTDNRQIKEFSKDLLISGRGRAFVAHKILTGLGIRR